jgi:hypothetical protein
MTDVTLFAALLALPRLGVFWLVFRTRPARRLFLQGSRVMRRLA